MKKKLNVGFWEFIAGIVLRNRILILSLIGVITILLALQWKNIRFTFTEANLLPSDDIANVEYDAFLEKFGEEGNLIVVGVKDDAFFTPKAFAEWNKLMADFKNQAEIDLVISVGNMKKLQKNNTLQTFELVPFVDQNKITDANYLATIKDDLFHKMPFYEGLLFNDKNGSIRSVIYMDKKVVNTPQRKAFILKNFIPKIEAFEKQLESTCAFLECLTLERLTQKPLLTKLACLSARHSELLR